MRDWPEGVGANFATVVPVLVLVRLESFSHVGTTRIVALFLTSNERGFAVMKMALIQSVASKSISASGAFKFQHAREKLPEDGLPWYFDGPERHNELIEFPRLVAYMMSNYFSISIYKDITLRALLPL